MPAPKKKVDWEKVDQMLRQGATGSAVAGEIGISYATLERRFKAEKATEDVPSFVDYITQKKEHGVSELLNYAYQRAKESDTVLIFLLKSLGKLYDRPTPVTQVSPSNQPIPVPNWVEPQDNE